MRVPLSWLREFVDVDLTPEQLAERLTLLGMEVKGDRALGRRLAERRRRRAAHGREAPARRPAVADARDARRRASRSRSSAARRTSPPASASRWRCPGAVLPGDRRIERTEKMGVVSNGMLCSGDELNLTVGRRRDPDPAADDAARGGRSPTSTATSCSTSTSSRTAATRCRSSGLAREVAAVTGATVRLPPIELVEAGRPTAERLAVDVEDPRSARGSSGAGSSGVTVGPSPDHVQMRLLAAGQRPDQQRRRRQQLRDARAGQADPHVRRRTPCTTAGSSSAARGPGERLETLDHVDARARPGHAAHRRPDRPDRHRRRHGRRHDRGDGRDDRRHRRVGDLRSGQHPPDRVPLRAPLRGEPPLREGPGVPARADRRGPDGAAHRRVGRRRRSRRAASTRTRTSPRRRASRSARRA